MTLFRIVLLIPMGYFLMNDHNILATAVLIVGAISDGLDGYIARKLNQVSDFGKLMDPIADKIFVSVALILLVADKKRQLNPWIVSLILSREFFVSGIRSLLASQGIILAAEKVAKWKTTFQFIGIGGYLLYEPYIPYLSSLLVGEVSLWISILLSYWSMMSYIRKLKL